MPPSDMPAKNVRLEKLLSSAEVRALNKADKLTLLVFILHSHDPEAFKKLDNLTWPTGQAILLASKREQIEKTNISAQIKEVPKSPYFIDTGHDNAAMQRLIELMMRSLGYEAGLINRTKRLFEVAQRNRLGEYFGV